MRDKFPSDMKYLLPIIFASSSKATFLVVESDNPFGLEAGTIVDGGTNFDNFFFTANSAVNLFEQLASNLATGNWEIKNGQIDRYINLQYTHLKIPFQNWHFFSNYTRNSSGLLSIVYSRVVQSLNRKILFQLQDQTYDES